MKRKAFLLAAILMSMAAQAKDIKTVVMTTTPQMHCESCENKIKSNLRFERGVKAIETSVPEQTVTITYDADKTTPEKIARGFEKFGYQAREVKDGESIPTNTEEDCPVGM